MLIHLLQAEEFMIIVSGKTGTNMVLQLGKQQMMSFKCLSKVYCQCHKQSGYNEEKWKDWTVHSSIFLISAHIC